MIRTSEIVTSKTHIEPLAEDGYVIYKLGYITPKTNGIRQFSPLWGNVKATAKATDSEVINATEETEINHYLAPDHLHLLEAYCTGGRGDGGDTHVAALVGTDPAVAGVIVYEDQTLDWNN